MAESKRHLPADGLSMLEQHIPLLNTLVSCAHLSSFCRAFFFRLRRRKHMTIEIIKAITKTLITDAIAIVAPRGRSPAITKYNNPSA